MKTYELLNDKTKWCQGTLAVTAEGKETKSVSSNAARWCLVGALIRCYGDPTDNASTALYYQIGRLEAAIRTKKNGGFGLGTWNDAPSRTYAEVVGLLKRLDI